MKTENPIRELYSRRASFYERVFVDFLGWGKELRRFFQDSDYLKPASKILDAGCGTGIVTRVLYQLAYESSFHDITFHAFDLTWKMLEVFQGWIERHGATDIELKQADVLDIGTLPLPWRDYDLIVSSTMLEYLPGDEVRQALNNLRRLLKSEGVLLLLLTSRNFITHWLAEKWWKISTFDVDEIRTTLQGTGFRQITFKDFSRRWSNYILVVEAK